MGPRVYVRFRPAPVAEGYGRNVLKTLTENVSVPKPWAP